MECYFNANFSFSIDQLIYNKFNLYTEWVEIVMD